MSQSFNCLRKLRYYLTSLIFICLQIASFSCFGQCEIQRDTVYSQWFTYGSAKIPPAKEKYSLDWVFFSHLSDTTNPCGIEYDLKAYRWRIIDTVKQRQERIVNLYYKSGMTPEKWGAWLLVSILASLIFYSVRKLLQERKRMR